jgi:AraC-like DNA-binding protein
MIPADSQTAIIQNINRKVSIMRYFSEVSTTNAKIKLEQNLFSFLLEGSKSVQYAGTKVTINPDQFLLLSAGNCLMSEKGATPGGRYGSILLFFDNELLTDFFIRHPLPTGSMRNKPTDEPFVLFEKDAFIVNFISSLSFIQASAHSLSTELQRIKLEELLVYISGRFPEILARIQHAHHHSNNDMVIRQAVTANLYSAVTIEELAFLCNMSLSTFKRRFAKIYGTSPNRWLITKRLQKAAQMLHSGSAASEIYIELGYENLSSFIQSFKQVYGTTPKQYQLTSLDV